MASGVDPGRYSARLAEASALRNAGRTKEAIAAYRDVLAIEPTLPDSWYNLAWLLRRASDPKGALDAYDHALRHAVQDPEEVWLNKGVIYADDLLDPEAAISAYQQALKLNPLYAPALFNLGNSHEDLGDRAAALSAYEKTIEIAPLDTEPLARIANLAKPASLTDPIVKRIEVALARTDLTAAARATLGFSYGKMLDQLGAYDEAFAAYAEANRSSEATRPKGYPAFDPARHDAVVQSLIDLPAPPAQFFPSSPVTPVFILGQFRSGSTLLEQVLSAHSGVQTLGEVPLLARIATNFFRPYPASLATVSPDRLEQGRSAYIAGVGQIRPGISGLVTDKRPDNFYHVGLILRLFPEAKILHTVRDARDVCLSTWFTHLDLQQAHSTDLINIGRQYRAYERLMAHWKSIAPDRILDVSYDALVSDAETEVRQALGFLGLPFEAACLDFHAVATPVKTASVWQVREPLYTRSSGRWRNYESHLGPLMEVLNDKAR